MQSPAPSPFCFAGKLTRALSLALAAWSSVAAADSDCVVHSLDAALSSPSPSSALERGTALKLLQTGDGPAPARVSCAGQSLEEIRLVLAPDAQVLLRLVASAEVVIPLELSTQDGAGEWQIQQRALFVDDTGRLQPVGDPARAARLIEVEITAGASNQPGQRQLMRLGGDEGFLLVVEDGREEGLFRDQFRVDPTIGQFSQRSQPRVSPRDHPDPVSGSSSL